MKSGDILAEVETDKATMDLEAFDSGILRKILVPEGSKVPVNATDRHHRHEGREDRRIGVPPPQGEFRRRQRAEARSPAQAKRTKLPAAKRRPKPRRRKPAQSDRGSSGPTATATATRAAASRPRRWPRRVADEKHVRSRHADRHGARAAASSRRRPQRAGQWAASGGGSSMFPRGPGREGGAHEALHHALGHRQAAAGEQDDRFPIFIWRSRWTRSRCSTCARRSTNRSAS